MGGREGTTVTTTDGRTLMFAEWGDPEGFPVFSLHGAPGSRFARFYDEGAFVDVGARVITYDRPGYGGSDRHPGRQVVDCVTDVQAIADKLGLDRFAVTGASAGGPHSLGVAARLPERVTRAACAVGIAPFDTPDFNWFENMDPLNVREIHWALEGEDVLAREFERESAQMLQQVADDPSTLLEDWELSEADRAQMAKSESQEVNRQTINEAFRSGVWGYADDTLCLVRPWGFDVSEISVPTRVIYGLTDVLAPRQHGEWLARNVPDAHAIVDEHGGHMANPAEIIGRYRWLVGSA
jgi:pimeloyl-ACP methyl ester carboxylesterase